MRKSSVLHFLRIVATTALLVYVFHKAGLLTLQGWRDLFDTFVHANLGFLLLSIAMVPLLDFLSSVKWFFLARSCGLSVGLWRLYAYYVIGKFFSLALPSSVGGDVIRVHELGRYTGRYADSAAVVFVERFSGLVTLVFLALIAVVVNLQIFNIPWLTISLSVGILGLGFICWLIIDGRPFNFFNQILSERLPLFRALFNKIRKFRNSVLLYKEAPGALWWALVNSLIFYFFCVVNVWAGVRTFNGDISFTSTLVATPVIMFIMNIPFSIGGIGLTEFAYTFTLGLFGINPTVAVSTALLMRLKTFFDAGLGSFLYSILGGDTTLPKEFVKEIESQHDKQLK
jgi:uncharacterized protein (TIRG00374 family)